MRLLLDTHVLLWWLEDDPKLPPEARAAIASKDNVVVVSAATIWELVIKRGLRKIDLPDNWYQVFVGEPFQHLPISWDHSREVESLPALHRDPFDRMLIAQARVEKLTLVTQDANILRYEVSVLRT